MRKDRTFARIEKLKTAKDLSGRYLHNMDPEFRRTHVPNARDGPDIENGHYPPIEEIVPSGGLNYNDLFDKEINRLRAIGTMDHVRSNAVMAYEVVITLPEDVYLEGADIHAFTDRTTRFLEDFFNPPDKSIRIRDGTGEIKMEPTDNVKSVVLHMDEDFPHVHAFIVPVDDKGRLNAKFYTGTREKYISFQDRCASYVQDLGIRRGARNSVIPGPMHRLYRDAMAESLSPSLPEPEKDETLAAYKERADHAMLVEKVHHNRDVVDLKSELDMVRSENVTLKKETRSILRSIGLDPNREVTGELTHEIGTRVRSYAKVDKAIREMPEAPPVKRVQAAVDTLLVFIREKEEREKDLEKELDHIPEHSPPSLVI